MTTDLDGIEKQLNRIADALERLASGGKPWAPNYTRRLEEYSGFDWESIGAIVESNDPSGATHVNWEGQTFIRRTGPDKFGQAIWFSRSAGKDEEGNTQYARLITFRKISEAEPLGGKVAEELAHTNRNPQNRSNGKPVAQTASMPVAGNASKPATSAPPAPAETSELVNASRFYEIALGKRFGMPREYAVDVARYAGVDLSSSKPDFGPAYMILPYFAEARANGLDFDAAADILHECKDDLIRATEILRKKYSGPK